MKFRFLHQRVRPAAAKHELSVFAMGQAFGWCTDTRQHQSFESTDTQSDNEVKGYCQQWLALHRKLSSDVRSDRTELNDSQAVSPHLKKLTALQRVIVYTLFSNSTEKTAINQQQFVSFMAFAMFGSASQQIFTVFQCLDRQNSGKLELSQLSMLGSILLAHFRHRLQQSDNSSVRLLSEDDLQLLSSVKQQYQQDVQRVVLSVAREQMRKRSLHAVPFRLRHLQQLFQTNRLLLDSLSERCSSLSISPSFFPYLPHLPLSALYSVIDCVVPAPLVSEPYTTLRPECLQPEHVLQAWNVSTERAAEWDRLNEELNRRWYTMQAQALSLYVAGKMKDPRKLMSIAQQHNATLSNSIRSKLDELVAVVSSVCPSVNDNQVQTWTRGQVSMMFQWAISATQVNITNIVEQILSEFVESQLGTDNPVLVYIHSVVSSEIRRQLASPLAAICLHASLYARCLLHDLDQIQHQRSSRSDSPTLTLEVGLGNHSNLTTATVNTMDLNAVDSNFNSVLSVPTDQIVDSCHRRLKWLFNVEDIATRLSPFVLSAFMSVWQSSHEERVRMHADIQSNLYQHPVDTDDHEDNDVEREEMLPVMPLSLSYDLIMERLDKLKSAETSSAPEPASISASPPASAPNASSTAVNPVTAPASKSPYDDMLRALSNLPPAPMGDAAFTVFCKQLSSFVHFTSEQALPQHQMFQQLIHWVALHPDQASYLRHYLMQQPVFVQFVNQK